VEEDMRVALVAGNLALLAACAASEGAGTAFAPCNDLYRIVGSAAGDCVPDWRQRTVNTDDLMIPKPAALIAVDRETAALAREITRRP
jgi:hypothetical protein